MLESNINGLLVSGTGSDKQESMFSTVVHRSTSGANVDKYLLLK